MAGCEQEVGVAALEVCLIEVQQTVMTSHQEVFAKGVSENVHFAAVQLKLPFVRDGPKTNGLPLQKASDFVKVGRLEKTAACHVVETAEVGHFVGIVVEGDHHVVGIVEGDHLGGNVEKGHHPVGLADGYHLLLKIVEKDRHLVGNFEGDHHLVGIVEGDYHLVGIVEGDHHLEGIVEGDHHLEGIVEGDHHLVGIVEEECHLVGIFVGEYHLVGIAGSDEEECYGELGIADETEKTEDGHVTEHVVGNLAEPQLKEPLGSLV